jgi:surface polysaccharide O-acyltransferase-like enzyme
MVAVVFIHNYGTTVAVAHGAVGTTHNGFIVELTRNLVSDGIARVAVPLFFMMSAYLFFYGFELSKREYLGKLRKRTRTLLVPLIFWNVATLSAYALGQAAPATKGFFSNAHWRPIATFGLGDYADAIFGLTTSPIAYQFWFIRDLIVLVVAAPVIAFIFKRRLGPGFILLIFALWVFDMHPLAWPNTEATLFFCLGAYLAYENKDLSSLDKYTLVMLVLFAPLLLIDAGFAREPVKLYFHKAMIASGVASTWCITSWIIKRENLSEWLKRLGAASFFLFAAHEPLLSIARKVMFKVVVPSSDLAVLSLYFSIPVCVIVFLVYLHRILDKTLPRLLGVVTGNRSRLAVKPASIAASA